MNELAFFTAFALVCTVVYLVLRYQHGYWRRRGIPHDAPHFPLGNIRGWQKTKQFAELLNPVYKKYKGTGLFAGFYMMLKPVALAVDLEFVKNVLIKDFNNFDDRGVFHNPRDDPLTGNLFQLDGARWRPLRHKLSPTFTSGKMKTMFPTVLRVGEEFARVFADKVGEALSEGDLEISNLLGRFTADVIGTCAFGLECNSLRNPNAEFVVRGKQVFVQRRHGKLMDMFMESFPKLAQRLRIRQVHEDSHEFYNRIVRETVAYRERNNIKRNDFMNILIELKNNPEHATDGLSVEEIAAQAFLFLVAGFETSSTTMGFTLYELAQHPELQQRLRDEINAVLARHNGDYSYECMKEMTYMEMVTSETLRKYPILPHLVRTAQKDYQTSDPRYNIEKGTMVMIPVYAIHHDPEIYPEPEKFDPERFTEEAIKERPACSWLPFGDGPRNCVGLRFGKMQMHIGLTYLLKNFRFSACDKTPMSINWVKNNVLLSSADGIHLKVEKI